MCFMVVLCYFMHDINILTLLTDLLIKKCEFYSLYILNATDNNTILFCTFQFILFFSIWLYLTNLLFYFVHFIFWVYFVILHLLQLSDLIFIWFLYFFLLFFKYFCTIAHLLRSKLLKYSLGNFPTPKSN